MSGWIPLRCGRMDRHGEHVWASAIHRGRHYMCHGHVIHESAWAAYDAVDDQNEDRMDRERRDA